MGGPTGYVAPEVIRRGPVDARSDIYSLGAVCYEAFSGTLPFPRGGGYEGLVKMINSRPTPLSERNAEVGPELNAVVMKALAKTPEARWQTVEDLMERLAAVALPEGIRAKVEAVAAA
jgi:serine/threonine-protein kinase